MATLTLTLTTASTTTATLTLSAADATRVMNAYQDKIKPGGTQQDITNWLADHAKAAMRGIVMQSEQVTPSPPTIT